MKKKILFLVIMITLMSVTFSFADTNIAIQDTILPPPNNFHAEGFWYSVNLDWDEPSPGDYNLIGYYLYREDIGRYAYLDTTQNEYIDYMVFVGTEYSYWLTAVYSEGESVPSDTSTAIPFGSGPPPELFDTDWHLTGWTTEPEDPNNWGWEPGYAVLNWSPEVENYDMSLISPEIVLPDDPDNIHNLTISMYIDDGSPDSGEVMEIWIIHGEQETMIFEWDLDENNDWGYLCGTDWVYSDMDQFAGETIQIKFRSHGSNTFNFNYWYIYMILFVFTPTPPYGTLEVTAIDSSGNPIEGITLNAVHLQDGAYYNAYTNENGIFTVSPMRPGEYQFTFYYNYPCPPEIVTGIIIQEDFISLFDITSFSTISISPTYIDTTMAPDDSMAVYITIQNHRDVPIHWFADIEDSGLNNRNDKVFRDTSDTQNVKINLKPPVSNPSFPNDSPSYLSTKATHGIIAPGQGFDWLLFLDTTGQTPGTVLEFDVVFTFDPNVGTVVVPVTVTIIEEGINDVPTISTKLDQNYPNPFSTSTTISFSLSPNYKGDVQIKIYNIKGQCIRELKIESNEEVVWNGKDESGKAVSSGIYFYRLEVGDKIIDTKKCLILR